MLQKLLLTLAIITLCCGLTACQSSGSSGLINEPPPKDTLGIGQAVNDTARSYGDQISQSIANSN